MNLQEIAKKYGDVDEQGQPLEKAKAKWIEENLTDEDIDGWHKGEVTDHTRQLMVQMGVECIQVWGGREGYPVEPLRVNIC